MRKQFYKDRAAEINEFNKYFKAEVLTEEKLGTLPQVIQKHFKLCGFLGKPIAMNADVIWKDSFIRLKPNQDWKPLHTLQFNSVNPIMRTTFMKVKKMFFTGKDCYKNGQGTMKGKILNLFTVVDVKGKEISQSALITSFCEMMLLSGYAFQKYVEWKTIDDRTVQGILTDQNFKVSGTFHFDEEGKFVCFESYDRYFDKGNGDFEKKKFIAKINSYKTVDNHYQPEKVSVSWLLNDEEYKYYKGTIESIKYNMRH
ncbi:MAG: hypothetical protein CSA40_00970 [Flavobacteriales bacterium]|nr:MAG: hypothetical protein CSA40_00970 [Flavobacteriales bacterium]